MVIGEVIDISCMKIAKTYVQIRKSIANNGKPTFILPPQTFHRHIPLLSRNVNLKTKDFCALLWSS